MSMALLKFNGTPETLDKAIANGLRAASGKGTNIAVEIIKAHLREFIAQKASCFDDSKEVAYLELFHKIFNERK